MKPSTRQLPGWVHIPLFVFMAISFYQTAKGFEKLLDPALAWAFSCALTMLMYGFTIFIGYRRINNLPVIGFLIAYFFFSLFSFAGNFNAVYTTYQEEQLYRDELLKHKTELNDVVNAANKALNNFNPDLSKKRSRVESLTQQLYSQITDEGRPGLGQRAREILSEIEGILGQKITDLAMGKKMTYTQYAENYRKHIDQMVKTLLTNKDYDEVEKIREEIGDIQVSLNKEIDAVLLNKRELKQTGQQRNLNVVNGINKIGSMTEEIIKDPTKFKFDKVKFENQEVGKIAFSFKSAFTQHPFIAILFTILCLFIDWAVVLSLLVFFGQNEKGQTKVIKSDRGL